MFGIHTWVDSEDFITQVAERTGKLLKGGEPDINNVCKSIIFDWQRGNIPYFTKAPAVGKEAKNLTREIGQMFADKLQQDYTEPEEKVEKVEKAEE